MITGNKGEWSEIYTFLKLLSDGDLYAADSNLNKIEDLYYPIIKILRTEGESHLEYYRESNILIKDSISGQTIATYPVIEFLEKSKSLYNELIKKQQRSFPIPEIEEFMEEIKCLNLKASSLDKSDITIVVHDERTGHAPTLGFSINK